MGEHRRRRRRRAPPTAAAAFGVFGRCSSARITWVMPMSMSSTTLARMNMGEPSLRRITKSSIVSLANVGLAPDEVDDDGRRPRGRPEPQRATRPGPEVAVAAEAVVARRPAPLLGAGVDLLAGAVAVVGGPRLVQRRRRPRRGARRWCDWKYGPSSPVEMPIQSRAREMPSVHSGRLRSASVSSMRRTNVPPCWRATIQL